jgi:hypothetical protein
MHRAGDIWPLWADCGRWPCHWAGERVIVGAWPEPQHDVLLWKTTTYGRFEMYLIIKPIIYPLTIRLSPINLAIIYPLTHEKNVTL